MKREGKQDGMVKTYQILTPSLNPKPELELAHHLTSRPTAGLFTKMPSKRTNHSKFNGKCGHARCLECHMHSVTKSKVKTKGSSKMRLNDINYDMLTWQVNAGGSRPDLMLSGFSATGILGLMCDDYCYDHDDEEEKEKNTGSVGEEIVKIYSDDVDDGEEEEVFTRHDADDVDERMSFCDVEMMMIMMDMWKKMMKKDDVWLKK